MSCCWYPFGIALFLTVSKHEHKQYIFQLVQLSNWLPDVFSQASGMEVARLSYLGPFFALSVFAEDNVSALLNFGMRI